METIVTPEEKIEVQQIYNYAAELMVRGQRTGQDVCDLLIEKGLDSSSALYIVEQIQSQIDGAKRSRARKDMLYGGLWLGGGLLITIITYSNARGGGSYVVTWGAIIFGGIQFFRGLANLV